MEFFAKSLKVKRSSVSIASGERSRSKVVRVAGAGHSFTPVVSTDGLLLDVSALTGVVSADPTRKRATALAGTTIREFYEPLWQEGLALKNQGDIDTQQIAGAVATATHGSGIGNTCFSGVVRGVRLVGNPPGASMLVVALCVCAMG